MEHLKCMLRSGSIIFGVMFVVSLFIHKEKTADILIVALPIWAGYYIVRGIKSSEPSSEDKSNEH